jgi:transposase-like protein
MKTRVRQGDPERERQWQAAVEQWRQSGQSVRDFCRAQGLKESAFYFWKRELTRRHPQVGTQGQSDRRQPASKTPKRAAVVMPAHRSSPAVFGRPQGDRARFLPVQLVSPAAEENRGGLEIALGDGRVIRVRAGFDRQTLADVLAVLEVPPC